MIKGVATDSNMNSVKILMDDQEAKALEEFKNKQIVKNKVDMPIKDK